MPTTANVAPVELQRIALAQIVSSPYQTRSVFDPQKLQELAQTLKDHGLMNPINVRPVGDHFELIAGERRWRAAQLLGWTEIAAQVEAVDDLEAAERVVVENLQREDLGPIERALGYQGLGKMGLTQTELAEKVGQSQQVIQQYLSLTGLPDAILKNTTRVVNLGLKHFIQLLRLKTPDDQVKLADQASQEELSVKELKRRVDQLLGPHKHHKTPSEVIKDQGFHFMESGPRVFFTGSFDRVNLEDDLTKFRGALILWVSQHPYSVTSDAGSGTRESGEGSLHNENLLPRPASPVPRVVSSEPRTPSSSLEMAELEALVPQGPSAVYTWIFGPDSPYATEFKGMTWKDLRIDPDHAIEKTLEGIKILQEVGKGERV